MRQTTHLTNFKPAGRQHVAEIYLDRGKGNVYLKIENREKILILDGSTNYMFANSRDREIFLFAGLGGNVTNKLKIKEPKTSLFRKADPKSNPI